MDSLPAKDSVDSKGDLESENHDPGPDSDQKSTKTVNVTLISNNLNMKMVNLDLLK